MKSYAAGLQVLDNVGSPRSLSKSQGGSGFTLSIDIGAFWTRNITTARLPLEAAPTKAVKQ
jgi:hypothetical protein